MIQYSVCRSMLTHLVAFLFFMLAFKYSGFLDYFINFNLASNKAFTSSSAYFSQVTLLFLCV